MVSGGKQGMGQEENAATIPADRNAAAEPRVKTWSAADDLY
jgi:hypothetical protein